MSSLSCLQVNGHSLLDADHHQAVSVLRDAGNEVTMVVQRETIVSPEQVNTGTHTQMSTFRYIQTCAYHVFYVLRFIDHI